MPSILQNHIVNHRYSRAYKRNPLAKGRPNPPHRDTRSTRMSPTSRPDRPGAQALREVLRRRRVRRPPAPGRRGDGEVDSALGLPARRTHVDDLDAADPLHRGARSRRSA